MPRYHFNVYDGGADLDVEGTQLTGIEEARKEAIRLAGMLLQEQAVQPTLGADWRVETTDGRGMILFRIDIMITESAAVK